MIAIIDYDAGNIKSVEKALKYLGEDAVITRDREEILSADKVILPGVGAFGDAMYNLKKYGLDEVLREVAKRQIPLLGICLGLQLLFERSDETPGVEGLGILKGEILRIPDCPGLKIPHMGWNSLKLQNDGRLFKDLPEEPYVYFVHSYYLKATDESIVKATTEYSTHIHASVEQENVFAGLEPVLSYKVSYPEDKDAVVVLRDIRQLEEEEPELHVEFAQETGEIFVKVMGQVQLQVLTQIIKDGFGYLISFGMGRIIYKETLAEPVMGVGHFEPLRHYAEVHLLMEPLEPGSGMQFDTICSEDVLDKNWQRLILTHLEEKEYRGVLTGAPITDMKITVTAGRAHQKHTEGGDFRQATYRAVRQGLMMGECRLLEPVYAFRLEIPTEMTGRAMNDITRMHGRFAQPEIEGEMSILTGTAPVATMQEYQQDVTAYTRGQGKLSCTLQGYEPCHNEDEVLAASTYDPELDMANPASSVFCAHGAGYIVDWYDVYDMMHVKEDPGFALAGMEDVLRNITSEPTEADEDNRKRMARERQDAGAPVYDEKELEDIFVRTYGSNSRENAAYNKAGFNRRNKSVSEADWYVKKAAEHGKSKTAGAQTPSVGSKTADTGIARPGAYRKQKGEKEYLLVDGYNVIFAWDDLKALAAVNIDSARDKLIDVMSNYQGYVGCELILVFDAYKVKQNPGSITKHGNIHVVYTKEAETADMYIEKTTHELGRKYKVTVASSDGLEQLIIMGQGALRMSSRGLREEVERVNQILRNDYLK